VSAYRSPSTDIRAGLDELQQIVTELSLHSKHIIIAGDLTIELLSSTSITTAYSDFLCDYNLTQHILEPSRVTATSATLIDHIITTHDIKVNSVQQCVGLSDHLVQFLDLDMSVVRPKPATVYICPFRSCDWDAIRSSLASTPWYVMDIFDDIDDMWHFFKSCLFSVLDQYAPLKAVRSKRPTPWMTPELLLYQREEES